MSRWLKLIVVVFAVWLCTATTAVDAAPFAYDALPLARVDAHVSVVAEAGQREPAGLREGFASLSVESPGTSTTLSRSFIATEAVPTVRHYTTSEAAESIMKGGEITPGSSGNIWVTPDRYVDGATAQSRLALSRTPDGYFEIPVCRVSCPSPPSRVQPWGGYPGGGIEITTTSPIDVTGLTFKTFGPR